MKAINADKRRGVDQSVSKPRRDAPYRDTSRLVATREKPNDVGRSYASPEPPDIPECVERGPVVHSETYHDPVGLVGMRMLDKELLRRYPDPCLHTATRGLSADTKSETVPKADTKHDRLRSDEAAISLHIFRC
jgi:hypothetical protein